MSEEERGGRRGIDVLRTPEKAQYQALKTELIQAAVVYDRSKEIYVSDNKRLSISIERIMSLKQLVEFM